MIRKIFPLMVGALLGIGVLAAFAPSASAAPRVVPAGVNADPNIISVAKWDRERHGSRCEYRRGECRHFYHGFYYETPWWTLPFAVGEGIGSNRLYEDDEDYYDDEDDGWSNSHIEWCLKRYRSYNPRNNTWVSYSGRVRECISPF
ncbi:MAG TPA: BA14K family protein [Aestuariivirga sp.]|nr:BA14K family protein [Aestuariivirga sp.]